MLIEPAWRISVSPAGVGGPSAGLAFALEVMQQLGRNVLHGHQVAYRAAGSGPVKYFL